MWKYDWERLFQTEETLCKKHSEVNYQCLLQELQVLHYYGNVSRIIKDPACLAKQHKDINKQYSCHQSQITASSPANTSHSSLRHCCSHAPLKRFNLRDKIDLLVHSKYFTQRAIRNP